MIFKIAWRNIWRNRLRSWVVIMSIILGVWAGVFMMALSFGMNDSRAKSQINSFISDIQIHHNEFNVDYKIKYTIPNLEKVEKALEANSQVTFYSQRLIVKEAMLISSKTNQGLSVIGVNPDKEKKVTDIYTQLIKGEYFPEMKGKGVLIGKKLADKLGADIKSKIIVRYQDLDGNILQTKFKVVGIFETVNSNFDGNSVYVQNKDLAQQLNLMNQYHEIAIKTTDKNVAQGIEKTLQAQLDVADKVEYWGEISPELAYADEMMGQTLYIFMGIIMIALLFGIVNTMLMAVLERKRELGMLMSIGMNKIKVFTMIVTETVMLAIIGGPLGIVFSYLSVQYFGKVGIDISVVGEGMKSFGMDTMLYPIIDNQYYTPIAIMVVVTAIIASIFPARRALKLKPAEAVRSF